MSIFLTQNHKLYCPECGAEIGDDSIVDTLPIIPSGATGTVSKSGATTGYLYTCQKCGKRILSRMLLLRKGTIKDE